MKDTTTPKKDMKDMKSETAKSTKTAASKTAKPTAALKNEIERKHMVDAKSSAAEKLRALFVDSLKDIYWAEKALTKAIPKMAKNATSAKLTAGLTSHLVETEGQISRLEQVFKLIGEKAVAKKCDAMDGLIEEGKSIMEETEVGPVRDAGIIAASQKIEHYEIATYGTLTAWAKTLGETDAAELLWTSLNEEKDADRSLTEAAYHDINFDAVDADEMMDEKMPAKAKK